MGAAVSAMTAAGSPQQRRAHRLGESESFRLFAARSWLFDRSALGWSARRDGLACRSLGRRLFGASPLCLGSGSCRAHCFHCGGCCFLRGSCMLHSVLCHILHGLLRNVLKLLGQGAPPLQGLCTCAARGARAILFGRRARRLACCRRRLCRRLRRCRWGYWSIRGSTSPPRCRPPRV